MHLGPKILWTAQSTPSRLALTLALSTAAHTWVILNGALTMPSGQSESQFVMQVTLENGSATISPAANPPRRYLEPSSRTPAATVASRNTADKATTPVEVPLPAATVSNTTASEIMGRNQTDTASSDDGIAPAATALDSPASIGPLPAPLARFAPAPIYPEEARWERRTGRVVLRFHLRANGSVCDAEIMQSSGHADIDTAARTALARWRFSRPHIETDAPWFTYAFRFDLT